MGSCENLPIICTLDDVGGVWDDFEEVIYQVFKDDFIHSQSCFRGKNVAIINEKQYKNKERSFWHIVSEGKDDSNRLPNLRRCERVSWVKFLIEICESSCSTVNVWTAFHNKSKRNRIYIWCPRVDYIVVLEDRKCKYQLITAFVVTGKYRSHFRDMYKASIKNESAHQ